jgi:hypothetical protein
MKVLAILLLLIASVPVRAQTAPAKPKVNQEQTTLFGLTLGQPDRFPTDEEMGLGYNAVDLHTDTIGDEPEVKIGRIVAVWLPEVCEHVEVALKDKFHSPTRISSWRGRNGLGLPISGKIWIWQRKNGDVVRWVWPSIDFPNCEVQAWTAEFIRKQPKSKDHL